MTQGVNNHSLPKAWIRTGMAAKKHIIQFRHAHSMEHGQSLTKTAIRHTRHHQWNYRLTGWSHGELGLSVMCCEVNLMLIRSIRSPALPLCSSLLGTPTANHSKSKLETVPANDEIPLSLTPKNPSDTKSPGGFWQVTRADRNALYYRTQNNSLWSKFWAAAHGRRLWPGCYTVRLSYVR